MMGSSTAKRWKIWLRSRYVKRETYDSWRTRALDAEADRDWLAQKLFRYGDGAMRYPDLHRSLSNSEFNKGWRLWLEAAAAAREETP